MEVQFLFSYINKTVKVKVKEDDKIKNIINKIILNDESLQDLSISLILCSGNNINMNETFGKAKIKKNDVIMVMCDKKDENEDDENSDDNNVPLEFKYQGTITKSAHVNLPDADLNAFIDRTFDAFKSLKNQYLLIFPYSKNYKNYSLICYDIIKNNVLFHRNDAHSERVFTCRHFLDIHNKRDLIITGSFDKTIKIWDISNNKNFMLIYQKKPDYIFVENTYLLSESLLYFNKNMYLIVSAYEIYSKGYNLLYYNINSKTQNCSIFISRHLEYK